MSAPNGLIRNELTSLFETLTVIRKKFAASGFHISNLVDANNYTRLKTAILSLSNTDLEIACGQLDTFFQYPEQCHHLFDLPKLGFHAALFCAPYAPQLHFEFFEYRDVEPSQIIKTNYPSIGKMIELVRSSEGLAPPRTVALFPENWRKKTTFTKHPNDRVYYFIDKFLLRHFSVTKPLLREFSSESFFQEIKSASTDEIKRSICNWLTLHEHFHALGPLPLPEFLKIKSLKATAGLEELRVDMNAVLAMKTLSQHEPSFAVINQQFLIAERLFRYAADYNVSKDYDAIAGQIFFGFLNEAIPHGISSKLDAASFQRILPAIQVLVDKISEIEKAGANSGDPTTAKSILCEFAKKYGNFDHNQKIFVTYDFYDIERKFLEKLNSDKNTRKRLIA